MASNNKHFFYKILKQHFHFTPISLYSEVKLGKSRERPSNVIGNIGQRGYLVIGHTKTIGTRKNPKTTKRT